MHNPQLPEDLAGLINDILGRMGRVEGAQCEADTLARLGDWVIHVASEAHEGTSQPEVQSKDQQHPKIGMYLSYITGNQTLSLLC